jgi:uncharacterized protein
VRELPMFPLGTVLFPHAVLPLHVFEPRYRALMHDVLAGDGRFGVVLISRGNEVGGGDLRTDVGTVARIVQAEELDDGRWATIAVGTQRIRVEAWLPDDPYPRAIVADLPDTDPGDAPEAPALLTEATTRVRRVLAMQAELGEPTVRSTFPVAEDPATACWQLAVVAPLNALDAQRILAVPGCSARLAELVDAVRGVEESYRFRLRA